MEYLENKLEYADYCALRESVGWSNLSQEQTVAALARTLHSVTVVDHGRPVAMGRLLGDGMYDVLVDVVVRPDCQGRGIGSAVIGRLLAFAASHTPEGGRTSVQLVAEPGKEHFYERFGFRQLPHAHSGTGMRRVLHGGEKA